MAVAHLALDADVSGESAHRALAVHVVRDELVEVAARLARDAQTGDESVVERDVREREVVRVGDGEAAGEPVAVDVAALDEEVLVVVDRPVGVVDGERVVVRRAVPEHDVLHLRARHEVRGGVHRERAVVGDAEHRRDVVLALGDAQHAVRRGGDRAHEARGVVRLAREAREVREVRVPVAGHGGRRNRRRQDGGFSCERRCLTNHFEECFHFQFAFLLNYNLIGTR